MAAGRPVTRRELRYLVHPERLIRTLAQPKSSPLRGSLRLSCALRACRTEEFFLPDTPNKKAHVKWAILFGAPGEIDSNFGSAKVLTPAGQPPAVLRAARLSNWGVLSIQILQIKKGPLWRTLFYLVHPERFELPTKWFED
jgi:hypothetical protein